MIHISTLFLYIILPIGVIYSILWLIYRFLLHPDYRWHQRGNICYNYSRRFSIIGAIIIYTIVLIFHYKVLVL